MFTEKHDFQIDPREARGKTTEEWYAMEGEKCRKRVKERARNGRWSTAERKTKRGREK